MATKLVLLQRSSASVRRKQSSGRAHSVFCLFNTGGPKGPELGKPPVADLRGTVTGTFLGACHQTTKELHKSLWINILRNLLGKANPGWFSRIPPLARLKPIFESPILL